MIDLASVQATLAVGAVEAIACRQPMFQRAGVGMESFTRPSISSVERCWRLTSMVSFTPV